MRRWLILFVLVILPVQLSWAAMAGYCQHEKVSTGGQAHVGHHEHQHEHSPAGHGQPSDADALNDTLALDDDCAVCHLGCAQPLAPSLRGLDLASAPPRTAAVTPLHESHIPSLPERPDRRAA